MLALQAVDQPRPAQGFGIQPLGRQIEDGKVGGVRRLHVFFADFLRFLAQSGFERLGRALDEQRFGAFLRVQQTLVVLERELGVDRQPHGRRIATSSLAPRQADREFDTLIRPRTGGHVMRVLLGSQHLFEQRLELDFAPGAARLDVAKHALEVAHPGGKILHLAQSFVHLLEAFADQLERFAQALFERRVQLFVDRLAHFLQTIGIVGLDRAEACLNRQAQLFETLVVALRQPGQLLREGLELLRLQLRQPGDLGRERLAEPVERLALLFAPAARRLRRLLACPREFLAQFAFDAF